MSSTRKEQLKDEVEINTSTQSTRTTAEYDTSQVQQEQQHSVNRALDETRNNIRRATDEARKDIPRYTQAANEYQEQTIQVNREIADNFLESQKEIINSFQSAWVPLIQRTYSVFWDYCLSPRWTIDIYARAVGSVTDNTVVAARLVNNTIFSNVDAFKTSIQNTRDNLKEFSRIGVNAARTYEQISRDTAAR
jgi:actin-related protein